MTEESVTVVKSSLRFGNGAKTFAFADGAPRPDFDHHCTNCKRFLLSVQCPDKKCIYCGHDSVRANITIEQIDTAVREVFREHPVLHTDRYWRDPELQKMANDLVWKKLRPEDD